MINVSSIKNIKSYRKISSDILRHVCVKYDYYTHGDCEEYSNMLSKVNPQYADDGKMILPELTDELLLELVIDIFNHSDTEKLVNTYACSYDELLESIASNIIDDSWTSYDILGTYEYNEED